MDALKECWARWQKSLKGRDDAGLKRIAAAKDKRKAQIEATSR